MGKSRLARIKKYWSSEKPLAKNSNYSINLYCEAKTCIDKHSIMLPCELPNDKELNTLLKKNFGLKILPPLKVFKRTYIYFKCPICGWEKFTKLQQIIEEKYINVDICKDCSSDTCLWVNCSRGGYLKLIDF